MSRYTFLALTISVSMLSLACSGDSDPDGDDNSSAPGSRNSTSQTEGAAPVASEDAVDAGPPKPDGPPRDKIEGNWIFVICNQGMENLGFLLAFAESQNGDGGKQQSRNTVTVLDKIETAPVPKIVSFSIQAVSVHLLFQIDESQFDFQGELRDGIVWGNCVIVTSGQPVCLAAYLLPTDGSTLQGQELVLQSDGLTELVRDTPEKGKVAFLKGFCKKHALSPLALEGFRTAIGMANLESISPKEVAEIADAYFKTARGWGPRMEQCARADVATLLALTRYQPDVAMKYLDEAESHLKSTSLQFILTQITFGKVQARTTKAMEMLEGNDPKEQHSAGQILYEIREKQPFDHGITFALAEYEEKQGQIDKAIEKYAELTVLPTLEGLIRREWAERRIDKPLPSELLSRLWKQQHGNSDGLDKYIHEVYQRRIHCFADDQVKARPADGGNQVALCEMFTSATSFKVIAADVAVGALQSTYPTTELITLRYYEHIPKVDALANQHSEARFIGYGARAIPSIYLNGKLLPPTQGFAGQFLPQAEGIYKRLRKKVDHILTQKTPIQINVSANAKDGELTVLAKVSGFQKRDETLRLRLVLAEEQIKYSAPNEIRSHDMVVRWMFGGSLDFAFADGQFSHSESIMLYDLRHQLIQYLTDFEQNQAVEFLAKPMELDRLHLVAFVQHNLTKEILQAAAVPVTGELDYSIRTKRNESNSDK